MTSPLRSFLQFAPLERKLRQVAEKSDWKERIRAVAGPSLIEFEQAKAQRWEGRAPEVSRLLACLEVVASPIPPVTQLSLADLLRFHAVLSGSGNEGTRFRQAAGTRVAEGHACLDPGTVPRALERLFEWTASQAFAEMHALEQMTLCQVRLYEIWPFEAYAGLAVDFFSLRVLYVKTSLLPLFSVEEMSDFQGGLSEAFRFVTKPLVDFYLRACERTCEQVLRQP